MTLPQIIADRGARLMTQLTEPESVFAIAQNKRSDIIVQGALRQVMAVDRELLEQALRTLRVSCCLQQLQECTDEGNGTYYQSGYQLGPFFNNESRRYQNFLKVLAYKWGISYQSFRFHVSVCDGNNYLCITFSRYERADHICFARDGGLGHIYREVHQVAIKDDDLGQLLQAQEAYCNQVSDAFAAWGATQVFEDRNDLMQQLVETGQVRLPLSEDLAALLLVPADHIDPFFLLEASCLEHFKLWDCHITVDSRPRPGVPQCISISVD